MAPSHGVLLASEGGRRLLYALTNFSAANFLQSAVGGGEPGVDTGFGVVALAVWKEVPTDSQMLVQRVNGAVSAGWYLQTSGASLRAVFVSGAGVPVVSASYTIVASDLGRVIEIDASISGGMIWLIVNRQLVGAGVAITGYTPAASEDTVWSLWETTQAFTSGMLLSSATYRGNPSVAQRNAYADETRILGDLPTTIQGATITHRHSLRDQLRAIGGAVTSGQTAPATLEDTITRAAADALARQGSPTVVTIDTSRDGRRALGVMGNSTANYLVTAGGAPIGGTSTLTFRCKIRHDVVAGSQNIWFHTTDGGTKGFTVYQTAGAIAVWSNATNAIVCSYATGTADLGRTYRYTIVCNGSTWYLYREGALLAQGAGTYSQSTSPLYVGTNAALTQPNTMVSIFDVAVGAGVATASEIQAADAADSGTIAGKTDQDWWDLTSAILAAGETVPATFPDRIGSALLTRRGVAVASGAVRVQTGQADFFRSVPGGGFRGSAGGFVVYWMGAIEDLTMAGAAIFAEVVSGSNAGWSLQSGNSDYSQIRLAYFDASGTFRISSLVDLKTIVSAGQIVILHGVWTGSYLQIFVQGTQRGADVGPYTGYASPAATEPMYIGSRAGSNLTPQNCRYIGFGAAAGAPSAAQIAAHAAACLAAGRVLPFVGFDDRRFDVVQDVTDAGGALPSFATDRAGSGEKLTRAGAPLQVAQRTERTWSYETSPIYYGASVFGAGDQYAYANGFVGDAAGFWALLWYVITSQSVPSATRILLGCGGWDIRTSLTHSTIGLGFLDGASSYTIVGTTAITAADIGKVQCFGFCWDGPAQQVRPVNKRAALAATARSGYTAAPGALAFGRVLSWPADAGISLLGFAVGFGSPANAEFFAAYDAGMAQERVAGIAERSSTLVDLTLDAKGNGGVLPAVLADRAGGGRALTRAGNVTTTPHYARAYG